MCVEFDDDYDKILKFMIWFLFAGYDRDKICRESSCKIIVQAYMKYYQKGGEENDLAEKLIDNLILDLNLDITVWVFEKFYGEQKLDGTFSLPLPLQKKKFLLKFLDKYPQHAGQGIIAFMNVKDFDFFKEYVSTLHDVQFVLPLMLLADPHIIENCRKTRYAHSDYESIERCVQWFVNERGYQQIGDANYWSQFYCCELCYLNYHHTSEIFRRIEKTFDTKFQEEANRLGVACKINQCDRDRCCLM